MLFRIWRFVRRLSSHLLHRRFSAFFGELASLVRRPLASVRALRYTRQLRRTLGGLARGRRVIIFPPTLDWHLPLYQRPQQLARAYSEKENTLVLYLTANSAHDHVLSAEAIGERLYLVNAALARELPALLTEAAETVVSLSWTANRRYLPLLRPDRVIYEYIDELEIFDGYDRAMRRDHLYLLRHADLTVCTARTLYEKARPLARRAIYSPNAGDYAFFSKVSDTTPAEEAAHAAARYSCTLGYYGALAGWFDYPLVIEAARLRPDWLFLLVGMDYDGTLPASGVLSLPNVLWIPPQPYERLPSFLRVFDVAMIPFVLNEITRSTSPVKLFEYMAAEKPILCSRMPECRRYRSVALYADTKDFLRKAEILLRHRGDPAYRALLRGEALENTWAARTDEILSALDSVPREEAARAPLRIKKAISE